MKLLIIKELTCIQIVSAENFLDGAPFLPFEPFLFGPLHELIVF
jgi:hypothetical protein